MIVAANSSEDKARCAALLIITTLGWNHNEKRLALMNDPKQNLSLCFGSQVIELRRRIRGTVIDAHNNVTRFQVPSGRTARIDLRYDNTSDVGRYLQLLAKRRRQILGVNAAKRSCRPTFPP